MAFGNIMEYLSEKISSYNKEKRNYFIFNIFLGIMVMCFFLLVKDTSVRQNVLNGWFDYYIKFRVNAETDTKRASQNIVYLDFDDKSIQQLQRPYITPRDKVADLVNIAYRGGAEIIIIDMEFSEPDYSPEILLPGDKVALTGRDRDKILQETIEKIRMDETGKTSIILPITTYADNTIKDNAFKDSIDNSRVFSATPTFTVNQYSDKKARFWSPYLSVLDGESSKQKILWSFPLLCVAIKGNSLEELNTIAASMLENTTDEKEFVLHSNNNEVAELKFYEEHSIQAGTIRDSQYLQYNRIQYVMYPPNIDTKNPFGNIPASHIGHWRNGKIDNEHINCNGKIVVIGRADKDSDDWFETPIGIIPGMYVHGNSIATTLAMSKPHLVPMYKHVIAELILIFIAACTFVYFNEFKAKCIIIVLTGLCWLCSYWYFCMTNEFYYFSFSFTSIGIYNFVNRIENYISRGVSLSRMLRGKFQ